MRSATAVSMLDYGQWGDFVFCLRSRSQRRDGAVLNLVGRAGTNDLTASCDRYPRHAADGSRPPMPVLRYFVFVGAALLALLLVVGQAFPALPTAPVTDDAATDVSTIRIRSDRKWPDRVVFDTSAPALTVATVVAAVPAKTRTANNVTGAAATADVADSAVKITARDAFAQVAPPDLKKTGVTPQARRKMAKRHVTPVGVQVAQRPQFGLFANNIW